MTIDPTSYTLLQKAQPTSAVVERSFSMLSKLLRNDKSFDVKNVKNTGCPRSRSPCKFDNLFFMLQIWVKN